MKRGFHVMLSKPPILVTKPSNVSRCQIRQADLNRIALNIQWSSFIEVFKVLYIENKNRLKKDQLLYGTNLFLGFRILYILKLHVQKVKHV